MTTATSDDPTAIALAAWRESAQARAHKTELAEAQDRGALLEAVTRFFGKEPVSYEWLRHGYGYQSDHPTLLWGRLRIWQVPVFAVGRLEISVRYGLGQLTSERTIASLGELGAWIEQLDRLHLPPAPVGLPEEAL